MTKNYHFQSGRLGFRAWQPTDIAPLAVLNADPAVMAFFPSTATEQQTRDFVQRMQIQLAAKGFCYFAVDELASGQFIGFIGLSEQTYAADFTPCVDIGWRLRQQAWGKGFATEGARACLKYAFEELKLPKIVAIAPEINIKSEAVMIKIGMTKVRNFKHPLLAGNERLETCVLYETLRD